MEIYGLVTSAGHQCHRLNKQAGQGLETRGRKMKLDCLASVPILFVIRARPHQDSNGSQTINQFHTAINDLKFDTFSKWSVLMENLDTLINIHTDN